jgi:hypothetical protein
LRWKVRQRATGGKKKGGKNVEGLKSNSVKTVSFWGGPRFQHRTLNIELPTSNGGKAEGPGGVVMDDIVQGGHGGALAIFPGFQIRPPLGLDG